MLRCALMVTLDGLAQVGAICPGFRLQQGQHDLFVRVSFSRHVLLTVSFRATHPAVGLDFPLFHFGSNRLDATA